jgi:hypothetical protein
VLKVDDHLYDGSFVDSKIKLPKEKIESVSYYFDGGRTALYINDICIYENLGLGGDFNIEVNNE